MFSTPFERVHKRKRIEELEKQTVALQRELQSITPSQPLPCIDPAATKRTTQSRTINGIEVTATIIDDCFIRYHQKFHPQLPVLDSSMSADKLYERSTLLFWVVLSLGSRGYEKHPTLVQSLSPLVTSQVMVSMNPKVIPIDLVKALILFLTWPFPSNTFHRTSQFALGGTIIHMAMQCGLHTAHLDGTSGLGLEGTKLWAYAVIVYQRICTNSGQPALMSLEAYNEQPRFKDALAELAPTLQLQFKLSSIIIRAQKAFVALNLQTMTLQDEHALDLVLERLNSQIDRIESGLISSSDLIYIAVARHEVTAMHFFKSPETSNVKSCQSIFSSATRLLELVLDQETPCAPSDACPCFVTLAILMGGSHILRLVRGSLLTLEDQEYGAGLYLKLVEFLKSCSVQKGDSGDRGGTLAEKLWQNDRIFRDADGSIDIALRVRNKFASSPMADLVLRGEETEAATVVASSRSTALLQDSTTSFTFDDTASSASALADGTFSADTNAFPIEGFWGDLDLDMNNSWGIFEPIAETS
ncbi:hypothetical protein BT63DRAFT_419960 [Microthyrium microscopicum]|uniref:Transcription factor domain-containing protein n=1 Tax=Microthyrium microscopicum TaxID=703497 RepID=A0A6A6UUE7_9PEZI|nr:hypothetical protein BT63DRAFT_419960 [Microthyrium microscopicum]